MTFREPEKLIVAIPTRDRPAYLNLTVRSVLEQSREHGHRNVEVVVSDPVSTPANAEKNSRLMRNLQRQFPGTPIHYYGPQTPAPIKKLLKKASQDERKSYKMMVPHDGHYGAHRNRLSLLAAYHGGRSAAYLHLDDDTPIALVEEENARLRKHPEDVLGLFLKGFKEAVAKKLPGFTADVRGVEDARVSGSVSREELKRLLKTPEYIRGLFGPGRIAKAKALTVYYQPYGKHEDIDHATRFFFAHNPSIKTQYLRWDNAKPLLAHIGVTGKSFGRGSSLPWFEIKEALRRSAGKNWPLLVQRMFDLGKAKGRGK